MHHRHEREKNNPEAEASFGECIRNKDFYGIPFVIGWKERRRIGDVSPSSPNSEFDPSIRVEGVGKVGKRSRDGREEDWRPSGRAELGWFCVEKSGKKTNAEEQFDQNSELKPEETRPHNRKVTNS
ncbi:hypothetical protein H6P81_006560 [Aristolochia fimbriata]|uniref:Uncharacterized protein n=1 Tax=Aristolochia fimbriata TaxID=158543 RepID=A0AAV7F0E9_ARIFI|nr:hypothetical protein H6P81_006560 [Aristolochia fimbriata]